MGGLGLIVMAFVFVVIVVFIFGEEGLGPAGVKIVRGGPAVFSHLFFLLFVNHVLHKFASHVKAFFAPFPGLVLISLIGEILVKDGAGIGIGLFRVVHQGFKALDRRLIGLVIVYLPYVIVKGTGLVSKVKSFFPYRSCLVLIGRCAPSVEIAHSQLFKDALVVAQIGVMQRLKGLFCILFQAVPSVIKALAGICAGHYIIIFAVLRTAFLKIDIDNALGEFVLIIRLFPSRLDKLAYAVKSFAHIPGH